MAYRPYPNADRALAQVHRHAPAEPEVPTLECLRPLAASLNRLRTRVAEATSDGARDRLALAPPPVDEYRLSTR